MQLVSPDVWVFPFCLFVLLLFKGVNPDSYRHVKVTGVIFFPSSLRCCKSSALYVCPGRCMFFVFFLSGGLLKKKIIAFC